MRDYTVKKPRGMIGYPIHRMVAAMANGEPHLWRDEGDTLILRTAAAIDADGVELPGLHLGELRLFSLRASVSTKVKGRHIYPHRGDVKARHEWLCRKGLRHGFQVISVHSTSSEARICDQRLRNFSIDSTDFTGVMKVTDPSALSAALRSGVGSTGKAFGFSLLSI